MTTRGLLSLAGLAALAGLSYGLLRWVESSLRAPAPADSQAPVLTVEQFRAVRLNLAGVREYVLEAPRLSQLPGQSGIRIEQPVLDWYQPDGEIREWRLRADQGWIAADQQSLRLDRQRQDAMAAGIGMRDQAGHRGHVDPGRIHVQVTHADPHGQPFGQAFEGELAGRTLARLQLEIGQQHQRMDVAVVAHGVGGEAQAFAVGGIDHRVREQGHRHLRELQGASLQFRPGRRGTSIRAAFHRHLPQAAKPAPLY